MIGILILVIALIVVASAVWKIHPLPVLILAAFLFGVLNGVSIPETIAMISTGFGNTMKSIGLVIIAGTIIGVFMEKRGALAVIANKIIALAGKKNTPLAMSAIGYVVSICIFCDSAFVILIGLWRKIGLKAGISLAIGASALSMGLFASHCFIPPTPGPLAAMSLLGADFGKVVMFGAVASAVAALAGWLYALRAGKNEVIDIPIPAAAEVGAAEASSVFSRHWSLAFLPIVLPLLLIAAGAVAELFPDTLPPWLLKTMRAVGAPFLALGLGAIVAIFLLGKWHRSELSVDGLLGSAVIEAAGILVITGAGGAFGEVLKIIDFKALLPSSVAGMGAFAILIPLAFSAVLKTAQGSSTLAILTAAGMTEPLLETLGMTSPVMRALVCCAVCCGGMTISHTNDSFFWVVTRFSGMNVRQGLKLQTLASLVAGGAAAVCIVVMSLIFY